MRISNTEDVVCILTYRVIQFIIMQVDFLSYREDFTNAAVFTELRSRIPQVLYISLVSVPSLLLLSC